MKKLKGKWDELDTVDKFNIIFGGLLAGSSAAIIAITARGAKRNNKAYENYLNDLLKQTDSYQLKQLEVIRDTLNNK